MTKVYSGTIGQMTLVIFNNANKVKKLHGFGFSVYRNLGNLFLIRELIR